jgi:hypothetical protein
MSGSFTTYFNRNNSTLHFYKGTKLRDLQSELYIIKKTLEIPGTEQTKLEKKNEKYEKKLADLEEKIERHEFLAANPDELVKEYLLTLPANRKRIELDDVYERHSLTVVPDLSRFTELRHLDLSFNRRLSSGFDRLPTTLKRLNCAKTNIPNEDTAWILRLVNLESLNLCRNDHIRELPDLSSLENLTDVDLSLMSLRSIPNLPLNNIMLLRVPIQGLPRYYSKTAYGRAQINDMQTFECLTKTHSSQIIRRINRINQFDRIREELLATGARIVLNPARMARLLDQSELDTDSDWSDIFEFQTRRVHTTVYSSY